MAAPAWDGWITGEVGPFAQAKTDDQIEQYVRDTCATVNHVVGTAAMGKTGSMGRGTGALHSDLTVKGTVGLRVVDASAFVSAFLFSFFFRLFSNVFIYIFILTSLIYSRSSHQPIPKHQPIFLQNVLQI